MNQEKWEQMELDTRGALEIVLDALSADTVNEAQKLIALCKEAPPIIRNRHEAYGHAAQWCSKAAGAVASIKKDTQGLLANLSLPEKSPLEAVSDIANSTLDAAGVLIHAAAEMKRILADLYITEDREASPLPMEELADSGEGFEEAGEPLEDGMENATEGDAEDATENGAEDAEGSLEGEETE